MDDTYIKLPAIQRKLKKAQEEHAVLYIHALGGYGKTAAVAYFLRNKAHLYLSGAEGVLNDAPPIEQIKYTTVVVDDISPIVSESSRGYIRALLAADKQLILIGRTAVPVWLGIESLDKRFFIAAEQDFFFNAALTQKLMAAYNLDITDEQAEQISQMTGGHAVTIKLLAQRMALGMPFGAEVVEQTRLDLYRYLDRAFYEQWDGEVKRAMLPLAAFDSFTLRMAELVTGNQNPLRLIERATAVSEFLQCDGKGNYQMRTVLRDYLRYKQQTDLTSAQRDNIYNSAGLYYELSGNMEKALQCYEESGNQEKIADLLIQNAEKHVGVGHYYETRNYYFALPEEQVKKSPALMAGMSILCSLLMQTEESEQWYTALQEYEQKPNLPGSLRKEARSRIAYLDIGLPHRGNVKISELMKNMAVLCTSRKLDLPEFSVTSNMPSVMSGGKDFCQWSKSDRDLARMLKKPAEIVLGSFGVGLANIGLAESSFEKNSLDAYEVMTLLNSGYSMADAKGKPEMCFAAAGIMARVHIGRKQPQVAYGLVSDLGEKFRRDGQNHLLPNLKAFLVWIDLLRGDMTKVEEWLQNEAPNENLDFYILERYRYLVKVKAYLATGQQEKAMSLIERLELYFEAHHRTYNQIENGLLRAMVQYRMKLGDWKKSLAKALQTAQEYGFVRVVAELGTAILPLLNEASDFGLDSTYQSAVLQATGELAVFYPEYLKPLQPTDEPISDTERQILELLCTDTALPEIAALCNITYNTVKYHNRNIYRKLGVKNRQQVQLQAKKLGLYGGSI